MNGNALARTWPIIAGATLVLVGLLGFVPNPIVGGRDSLMTTDATHNIIHIGTGLIALAIYFMSGRDSLRNGLIGFGILYAVIFVTVLASPNFFGLFEVPANAPLHLIHLLLATISLYLGFSIQRAESGADDVRHIRAA